MSNGEVTEISVEEAAARFIATLPVAKQEGDQQEVKQFILWYGRTCLISRLSVTQVDDYTEWVAQSTVEPQKRLEPVRAFLNYARKEELIATNLAQHVKAKKSVSKSAVMGKAAVSADQSILTAEGKAELEKEMVHLKSESVKASQAILIAAADKDFRENAPLEAARELHGRIMGRLRDDIAALGLADDAARAERSRRVAQAYRESLRGETISGGRTRRCAPTI